MAVRTYTTDVPLVTARYPGGTHFRSGEFNKGNAQSWKIADDLVDILEAVRRVIGHDVTIYSGYRQGSRKLHGVGCAADIGVDGFSSWELGGLLLAIGHGTWENRQGARKGGAGIAYLGAQSMSNPPHSLIHVSVPEPDGRAERMYVYRNCEVYVDPPSMDGAELIRIQNEARRWQPRVAAWDGGVMLPARPWNLQDPSWIVCPRGNSPAYGFQKAPPGYTFPDHESGMAQPAPGYSQTWTPPVPEPGAVDGKSKTVAGPIAGILGVGLGLFGLEALLA